MRRFLMFLFQRIAFFRAFGMNRRLYVFDGDAMGGFRAVFRRYWMDAEAVGGAWRCRVMVGTQPYHYLLASARQGNVDNIHGYCMYMYSVAMCLTTDKGLSDDLSRVLKKYDARVAKRAKTGADAFEDAMALKGVRRDFERGQMTRGERRKAERKSRKDMKEGLKAMSESGKGVLTHGN